MNPLAYAVLEFVHVLGAVLLLGNVTATAVWKVFADRTGHPPTVAFAQRLVTYTDWALTGGGIVLVLVGGYGMALMAGLDLTGAGWLLWAQALFAASGAIWLLVLVPIQVRQARMSRRFAEGGVIPLPYRRLGRRWLAWGIVATVPLVAALAMMVSKLPAAA